MTPVAPRPFAVVLAAASLVVLSLGLNDASSSAMPYQASASATASAAMGSGPSAKLHAVSASTPTDAWAVGVRGPLDGHDLGLTRHWDGTGWTVVPSPHPGEDSFLWGVADVSPGDAWAVGESLGGATILPLAEHWDGTTWQVVPLHGAPGLGRLNAVSATGPDDVWMAGTDFLGPSQTARHFLMHWDGSQVSRVRASKLTRGANSDLTGLTSQAADDVWAVGTRGRHGTTNLPLIEHYDGVGWSKVPGAPVGGAPANLSGVDADSSTDAWTVGWDVRDGETVISALAEHWNGTQWTQVAVVTPGYASYLTGVSVVAADDVWAVGSWVRSERSQRNLPLIEHWDGHAWSRVTGLGNPRRPSAIVEAVSMDGPADGFAVGEKTVSAHHSTYSLHWDGLTWSRV